MKGYSELLAGLDVGAGQSVGIHERLYADAIAPGQRIQRFFGLHRVGEILQYRRW